MAYFHMSIYTGQQLGSRSFFMSYNLDEGSLGSWKEEPDILLPAGSTQVEGDIYMAGLCSDLLIPIQDSCYSSRDTCIWSAKMDPFNTWVQIDNGNRWLSMVLQEEATSYDAIIAMIQLVTLFHITYKAIFNKYHL